MSRLVIGRSGDRGGRSPSGFQFGGKGERARDDRSRSSQPVSQSVAPRARSAGSPFSFSPPPSASLVLRPSILSFATSALARHRSLCMQIAERKKNGGDGRTDGRTDAGASAANRARAAVACSRRRRRRQRSVSRNPHFPMCRGFGRRRRRARFERARGGAGPIPRAVRWGPGGHHQACVLERGSETRTTVPGTG